MIVAPWIVRYTYDFTDWDNMQIPPSFSTHHYLGTDLLGRDLLSRAATGGRISCWSVWPAHWWPLSSVRFMARLPALSAVARFADDALFGDFERISVYVFRDSADHILRPHLLLIFAAVGLVSWLDVARIVRGQTLSLKHKEFVEAARVSGVAKRKIVTRHIIPNVLGVVMVYASLLVPGMIMFESFLSFLGLGVQEPMTSWGSMLQEGAISMEAAPWQLLVPSFFLVTTLFCFNFIGDGLRDALDPKDR